MQEILAKETTRNREIVKFDLTFILILHTSRILVQLTIFLSFILCNVLYYVTYTHPRTHARTHTYTHIHPTHIHTMMLTNLVEEGSHVMRPLRYEFRLENIAISFF